MTVEQNKRLAQTKMPNGTVVDRPWTSGERYQLYRRGFRDGAGGRGVRHECEGLGAYDRGYAEGRATASAAISAYAQEIGYTPTILRDGVAG